MAASTRPDYDIVSPRGSRRSLGTVGHVVYAIYALSLFTGLPMLIGVVIAYLARSDARGTVGWDHFTWAIRTFWATLLLGLLFWALVWVVIGWPLLAILWVWTVYRIIRGWLAVANGRPLYR
jgi:uncharacterized membrane protein